MCVSKYSLRSANVILCNFTSVDCKQVQYQAEFSCLKQHAVVISTVNIKYNMPQFIMFL